MTGILDQIPVHDAAHGFRRGRSVCTFASPHVGQRVVVRLDLHDFFPSVLMAQVQAVFRTVGYPDRVADLLAALCCHSTPDVIWHQLEAPPHGKPLHKLQAMYSRPHLPQGAPTSPSLANLCAYRLDCRLASLAQSVGARYTRYADDIAFSGGVAFHRMVKRFCLHVCTVMMEQGFSVHYRKTRIMRQAARQQLAGIVLNDCLNVRRFDYGRGKGVRSLYWVQVAINASHASRPNRQLDN